jgi:hypothetical protein
MRPKRVPGRILGVDFSGANDAGKKIWIAECKRGRGNRVTLMDLRPATDLPKSGIAPAVAIAALAHHVAKVSDTIVGCDFPFTLPKAVMDSSWEKFAADFPKRFADPDSFRNWALRRADGREIRRAADREAKTPFNSYNLRIYRQTWWGIAHLLSPLVRSAQAIVRPFQPLPRAPTPILIEACPASSLKGIHFYPAYKGRGGVHRLERKAVLRKLIEIGVLEAPSPRLQAILLDNAGGDALDALIAAIATARAAIETEPDLDQAIEGIIYFALHGGPAGSR